MYIDYSKIYIYDIIREELKGKLGKSVRLHDYFKK